MEKTISFNSNKIRLEGRLGVQSSAKAALITHPHPLYGGDMDNAVVCVLADVYAQEGWSTLRFNFRGTGCSQGQFEDGLGEQQDVDSAITFLKTEGFNYIDLIGYSFGAWVLAGWSRRHAVHPHRIFLVAPPVAFIDFDQRAPIPGLRHVFTGSLDDLAPPIQIETALPHWHPNARLSVIQGADHSYWGHFQTLHRAVTKVIR